MTAGTGPDRPWSGRSQGGGFGHRLVYWFARLGGVHLCYFLLIPPTLWYFWRLADRRRVICRYWQRLRPGLGRWGCLFMAARHFWSFARILADRFLVGVSPGSIRWRSLGDQALLAGLAHREGCVLLSAHLGNWELSSRWLEHYPVRALNVVMLMGEDPRIAAELARAMGAAPFAVIDVADPFGASLAIAAALRRGETCCMLGDRTAGTGDHTIAAPLLGGLARFPTGPFIAAAATGAVVMPTYCVKCGWRDYALFADEPWTVRFADRAGRQAELERAVARWARSLERMVRRYPMQWHNFYDFWAPAR